MLRKAALLLLSIASPAVGQAATCHVDGVDAFRRARDGGFEFRLMGTNGVSCNLYESTLILTARPTAGAICRYLVFAGRNPAPGWDIRRVVVSGENIRVRRVAGQTGFVIELRAGRGRTNTVSATRIVLAGPHCAGALDSFADLNLHDGEKSLTTAAFG